MKKKDFTRRRFIATVSAGSAAAVVSGTFPTLGNTSTVNNNTSNPAISDGTPVAPANILSASQPWWVREGPLRLLDNEDVYHSDPSSSPSLDASQKNVLAFNADHLQVMGMAGGLDDQEFFFYSKVAGKKNEDYLAKYLPEAKKNWLRTIVYFNVHWFKRSFGEKHPDWLQLDENGNGNQIMYSQPSSRFCVNSPWREWVFQVVRDLCAYPIDGIFYDGPGFTVNTCYCHYCQDKYQKQYSEKLPSKKQRKGKLALDLLEFQTNSIADFLRDSNAVIKSVNPEILFYKNGGVRGGNWSTANLNRVLISEQDMLGSEGGYFYGDMMDTPVWKPGVTARLLETQSPDKPRVIFSTCRPSPWQYAQHSEADLRLIYAGTVANAANPMFEVWKTAYKRPEIQALIGMNRFVKKNATYYRGTRSEATTALVWSDTTANFYDGADAQLLETEQVKARSEIGNLDGEFSGLADALIRSQTPFDVIDDTRLVQEKLNRYTTIFLPNVACMSDKTVACLKEYVQQGGNLFATFETSLYDETGIRRPDFALTDMFGVSDKHKIVGPDRWGSMQPSAGIPLLEGWARDLVPAPTYHVTVKLNGGDPLVIFMQPLPGSLAGIPVPSDEPAMVTNRYGKGKVVYFSGDIGNGINSYHLLEWIRLIENVLREMSPSPVVVENAPRSVEVVLRSQEDGKLLLLHLVNFTGEMTRPIRKIVPLENVRITVRTKGAVKKIHTLMRPETLTPLKNGSEEVQFVVPHIGEYEVIVLEM